MGQKKGGKRLSKRQVADAVQGLFQAHPGEAMSLKQVFKSLRLDTHPAKMLAVDVMEEMAWDDYLSKVDNSTYRLNLKTQVQEGTFIRKSNGKNSFLPDDGGKPIFVSERNSMSAMGGDRVRVAMMARRQNHIKEAIVTEILERKHNQAVGILQVEKDYAFLITEGNVFAQDVLIPKKKLKGGKTGEKAVVRITQWPGDESKNLVGEVIDVLGRQGENDVEMHAILAQYDLPYKYPQRVEEAANKISADISPEEIARREDFRDVTTFTIDPADAKDFDDALSYRKLENGNMEVGIHIADVTYYVRPGTPVDKEAFARGTSVYLVDRTIPMLPEKLSNKLCSLRPHEDKLCFSAVFELNAKAKVIAQWFGRTVICSDYRFDYEQAQQIIETKEGPLAAEILDLHALASVLRKQRFDKGAISFERPEMKVIVDETGKPVDVMQKESKESNWLIEEFMLLANRCVAEYATKKCKAKNPTFVYRIHENPDPEKLDNLRTFAKNFGHKLGDTSDPKQAAGALNTLMKEAKGKPEENALQLLALRSMARARYSTDNVGHYGLAFPFYTHFTSPIRRYPDMMVHRLLAMYMDGATSQDKLYYEDCCEHSSVREQIATDAERASIKYKMVEFMQDKIGRIFDGHVSGLTEWGIYVEIEPTKIEGMVSLRDIRTDWYQFDEEKYETRGKASGRVFHLGDAVKIRVLRANLEQKILDYELVEE